ncbi:unnamed protein product [Diabrotica balteata]|uniref:Kazal-like domain-containing protein n=1 Tax=Diabrotica balteata TaxID=107213 RepID=A0A9N9T5T8_DIABA|nr:unnamed protein product [Diabrotica balteata]
MNIFLFVNLCLCVTFLILVSPAEAQDIELLPAEDFICSCILIIREVCASNGETYDNECWFKCAQQEDPNLQIVSQGRCDQS